jgi:hypothetical protein
LLIATRFGNSVQLHEVAGPGMDRTQISFEEEPISGGSYAPHRGDVLVVSKDVGGGEFYQLYTLRAGRLALLTDGKSRNEGVRWDREGARLAYSSTRRNGTDSDLYLIDPRLRQRDPLCGSLPRRAVHGGNLEFRDLPREHPELSARPAPCRVRR